MYEASKSLAKAIHAGNLAAAKFAVAQGADLNAAAELAGLPTLPPLHRAAQCCAADICQLLIEAGADVSARDNFGQTPLHFATNNPSLEVLMLLLEAGSLVNVADNLGNTPLHAAGREVIPGCCALLLARGADLFALTHDGRTALHSAAAANKVEVCRLLIAAGLHLNFVPNDAGDRYCTPFQTAVSESAIDVVRMGLEEFGEVVAQETRDGQSLFDLAVDWKEQETETFELLLAFRSEQAVSTSLEVGELDKMDPDACRESNRTMTL